MPVMFDLDVLVVGAGPGGIAVASEARAAGIPRSRVLVLEKTAGHSGAIRGLYPQGKPVTANYKGVSATCEGVLCLTDGTKDDTLAYLDGAISEHGFDVHYGEEVFEIGRMGVRFGISTSASCYTARVVVIAIGIFGRPNKPSYKLPRGLRDRIHFDVTSSEISGESILVVGGGDSASEYCQHLARDNGVTLAYRRAEMARMHPGNREAVFDLAASGEVELWLDTDIASVSDGDGRPQVTFSRGPVDRCSFDRIVYALGGTTPVSFLRSVGVALDGDAPVFERGYETTMPGLYLAGDLVAGRKGGSIIGAFNASRRVMQQVCDDHLGCTLAEPLH